VTSTFSPADEHRHVPGSDPWWAECWTFDAWTTDARSGVYTSVVLLPNQQRAWYWCALVRPGRPLVTVVDLDQTLPVSSLRLRRGSLWADHTCEEPFEQWTVVNETYGVALDDPDEALRRVHGEQTPIAFDLEWYATGPAEPLPDGYEQPGEVHGVVELKSGPLDLVGPGRRSHWWGVRDWFGAGWGEPVDGIRAPVLIDGGDGRRAALERVLTTGGWREWVRPLPSPHV
jgi:hypothetical protein